MATLTIVADENIINAKAFFSRLGKVISVDGRRLENAQVLDADILLVRSVTKVNRQLLAGSRVRFVGSATIGIDHLDTQYLDERGIEWASAPGSNANSVVDYIISALCRLEGVLSKLLSGGTVGIVGVGNVGSRLYQRLHRLGVSCSGYDPLIPQDKYPILTDLSTVLNSDVVCCHTPLTDTGNYPTKHMFNFQRLCALKKEAVLINAGRGATIDNQALKRCLTVRTDLQVVLDVWEGEPSIDCDLLTQLAFGSAHIAGYSTDGKIAGTRMIYKACCQFLAQQEANSIGLAQEPRNVIMLSKSQSVVASIQEAVLHCYDIDEDDKKLREVCTDTQAALLPAQAFDKLRKNYPVRREFSRFRIGNTQDLENNLSRYLSALGFDVDRG